MLNEPPLIITPPSLLQKEVVGGPPLVSPTKVKLGGSDRNEEEVRDTWLDVIWPYSA